MRKSRINIVLSILPIIIFILTNCSLAQPKEIWSITSGVYYDGDYVIYTREYVKKALILADTYTFLGDIIYIIDLNNDRQFVKLFELEGGYSIPFWDDYDIKERTHLCVTNQNAYISSKYLYYVYRINLNTFETQNLDPDKYYPVEMYELSPDESEEIYKKGCLFYNNFNNSETMELTTLYTSGASRYYDVNWTKKLLISGSICFTDIKIDSTWHLDIDGQIYKYGIKWIDSENILLDTDYYDENQWIAFKDSSWQVVGTLPDKYFTMAEDSTYCLVDGDVVSIYDKDDVLIREIKITEGI